MMKYLITAVLAAVNSAVPIGAGAESAVPQEELVRVSPADAKTWRFYMKRQPNLHRYDKVIIAETKIEYRHGVHGWRHREEKNIRARLQKLLRGTLANGDYWTLTDEIDERTLIAKVSIIDLDVQPNRLRAGFQSTGNTSFVSSDGNANVAFDLFDAITGESVLRFVERYRLPGGSFPNKNIDARRLALVLKTFTHRMGTRMERRYAIARELERKRLQYAESTDPAPPDDKIDGGEEASPAIASSLSLPEENMLLKNLAVTQSGAMSAFAE